MTGAGLLGGLTEGDDQRRVDVALHVLSMLRARAMTPGDQVMVLMMAAASICASNTATPAERAAAVSCAGQMLGSAVAGAERALDRWMADLPAAGCA